MIDRNIEVLNDVYRLQGVIWHHGVIFDSGHYTSMVKHNNTWYHISDTDFMTYDVKFTCNDNGPFFLY
jgi:ubiquitin C-terminal hydrolase